MAVRRFRSDKPFIEGTEGQVPPVPSKPPVPFDFSQPAVSFGATPIDRLVPAVRTKQASLENQNDLDLSTLEMGKLSDGEQKTFSQKIMQVLSDVGTLSFGASGRPGEILPTEVFTDPDIVSEREAARGRFGENVEFATFPLSTASSVITEGAELIEAPLLAAGRAVEEISPIGPSDDPVSNFLRERGFTGTSPESKARTLEAAKELSITDFFLQSRDRLRERPDLEQFLIEAIVDVTGLTGIARSAFRASVKTALKSSGDDIPDFIRQLDEADIVAQSAITKLQQTFDPSTAARRQLTIEQKEEFGRRAGRVQEIMDASINDPDEAFRLAQAELRGQLADPAFDANIILSEAEKTALRRFILELPADEFKTLERVRINLALNKVLSNQIPQDNEILLLERAFGPDFGTALRKASKSKSQQIFEAGLEVANLPRSFVASFDLSAPLRQGITLAPGHPKIFAESTVAMHRALISEDFALAAERAIKTHPNFEILTEHGLFIADRLVPGGGLVKREEAFMSNLAGKVPGIKQSERAYVTFLNKLRFDTANSILEGWRVSGKEISGADIDDLSRYINIMTGRGNFVPSDNIGSILNATFFSPRLLTSRLEIPFFALKQIGKEGFRATVGGEGLSAFKLSPVLAKDLVGYVGTGIGILTLMELNGFDVETDPRSSDFGRIVIGDTRLDFWAGFQPIARLIAQMQSGQIKSVNSQQLQQADRLGIIQRFIRSKLAPTPGFGVSAATGTDFLGDTLELNTLDGVLDAAAETLMPLFFQDVIEAITSESLGTTINNPQRVPEDVRQTAERRGGIGIAGAALSLLGFYGVGVNTFDTSVNVRQRALDRAGGVPDSLNEGELITDAKRLFIERPDLMDAVMENDPEGREFIRKRDVDLQTASGDFADYRRLGIDIRDTSTIELELRAQTHGPVIENGIVVRSGEGFRTGPGSMPAIMGEMRNKITQLRTDFPDVIEQLEGRDIGESEFLKAVEAYTSHIFDPSLESAGEFNFSERERRLLILNAEPDTAFYQPPIEDNNAGVLYSHGPEVIKLVENYLRRNEQPLVAELRADREVMRPYFDVTEDLMRFHGLLPTWRQYSRSETIGRAEIVQEDPFFATVLNSFAGSDKKRLRSGNWDFNNDGEVSEQEQKRSEQIEFLLLKWGYINQNNLQNPTVAGQQSVRP